MSLTIHTLIAALESADVWDVREIDARPVAETIATLREYAYALTMERESSLRVPARHHGPLTEGT